MSKLLHSEGAEVNMSESEKARDPNVGRLNLQIRAGDVLSIGKTVIRFKRVENDYHRVFVEAPKTVDVFLDMSGRKRKVEQKDRS